MPFKLTKPLGFSIALLLFLLALEIAIPTWRRAAPVSNAPVFSLPLASEAMENPGAFAKIVRAYRADRGCELKLPGTDGSSLTLFYFEWDQIDAGPMMDIVGHSPEECNVAAGFKLESNDANRAFEAPNHSSLVFDATSFTDPNGRKVHVYKNAWLQGFGSRDIREGGDRLQRFKNSFVRGSGAARVIECGVIGARDETHAWQIFQREVLDKLEWTGLEPEE